MFCTNCGTKLADGQKMCPNCGALIDNAWDPSWQDYREQNYQNQNNQQGYQNQNYQNQNNQQGYQNQNYQNQNNQQGYQNQNYQNQNSQQGYQNQNYQQQNYQDRNYQQQYYQQPYYPDQRSSGNWGADSWIPAGAGTNRSIALCIIFTIISCGIYGIYWIAVLNDEINQLAGEQEYTSGVLVVVFGIITCGIYLLVWNYKMGEQVDQLNSYLGENSSSTSILYLILAFVGLQIINSALMQDTINKFTV